ncbi:MAG TPA: galactose oxidase [Chthoniobacteraceae bacterium]|nr:galactose oxidase [Chthoniobacteraceae bacterium]
MFRPLLILNLMTSSVFAAENASLDWKQLQSLPDPLGFAAPFAGVSGGALIVAGGANFPDKMPWEGGKKVWHDNVWLLKRPNGAWREVGKLPRPLGYGVCVTHRDSVLCVGGSDSERHYADAFRLTWNGGKLLTETLPSLPTPLSGGSGALVNDTLFVACGAEQPGEQSATNRAFALDLSASKPAWRELPPLPGKPRMLAAGSAHGDAFYVIGGVALEANNEGKIARVYLREAWRYKDGQGWQRIADLPKPSVAAASPAPVIAGRLLLLGGDDGSRVGFQPLDRHPGFPDALIAYDVARNVWREAGNVPAPRATLPCIQWNERYVLPSGESRPGVRSPEVWSITQRQ